MVPIAKSFRLLIVAAFFLSVSGDISAADESVGSKIKKIFASPTPTPSRKHRKRSPGAEKDKSTPKPSASPTETPSPKPKDSPEPSSEKASPSPSAKSRHKPKSQDEETPSPAKKGKGKGKPKASPTTEPEETPKPTTAASPSPSEKPELDATPIEKRKGAPATISSDGIKDYEKYTPEVRKVLDLGLSLTSRNLDYKYGSADPAAGGMDCSGFVYYVLTQSGVRDVPRDASQQYVWIRKSGKFQAVNSHSEDSFELEDLTPGDLMFWTGTYNVEKDPPITHSMIYVGREKATNQRIMIGSSDGRSYRSESRFGVSVFDFKPSRPGAAKEGRTPTFIGYGHVPGIGK